MANAAKQLFQGQLGNANATLYTDLSVNAGRTKITNWKIANTDSVAHPVTIDIVPAGGSAGVARRIWPATVIPANTLWVLDEQADYVEAGGTVQGFSDLAAKVTVTLTGELEL